MVMAESAEHATKYMATASSDGEIKLWSLALADELAPAATLISEVDTKARLTSLGLINRSIEPSLTAAVTLATTGAEKQDRKRKRAPVTAPEAAAVGQDPSAQVEAKKKKKKVAGLAKVILPVEQTAQGSISVVKKGGAEKKTESKKPRSQLPGKTHADVPTTAPRAPVTPKARGATIPGKVNENSNISSRKEAVAKPVPEGPQHLPIKGKPLKKKKKNSGQNKEDAFEVVPESRPGSGAGLPSGGGDSDDEDGVSASPWPRPIYVPRKKKKTGKQQQNRQRKPPKRG